MAERPPKDPFWIATVAAVAMLVGARLLRAYTPLGYNVFAESFDPWMLLLDIVIHFVIYFAVWFPLRALWVRRSGRA